ncbi:UPF0392 protein [Nymphaea thermarum]|nr:UPF0392 protein [Nymphaea thermarum]
MRCATGKVVHVLARLPPADRETFNWRSFGSRDRHSPRLTEMAEVVMLSDQALIIIDNYAQRHLPTTFLLKHQLLCTYTSPRSSSFQLQHPVAAVDAKHGSNLTLVRCPCQSQAVNISLMMAGRKAAAAATTQKPLKQAYDWRSLAYEAVMEGNPTVVFAKGLNLRPARLTEASIFDCVFGYRFDKPGSLLSTRVVSAAQEVFRCETPLILLKDYDQKRRPVKVSIRSRYHKKILPSVARPTPPSASLWGGRRGKWYSMCVCTMIRNQARFLREWITYHAHIGVQRWFVYDNGSDDDTDQVIRSLHGYNVTKHAWPWIKTQEAGFSHCSILARHESCEWVGFIDVDEFLYFPRHQMSTSMEDHLKAQANWTGELRVACRSFGPSGLSRPPDRGVMVGYTCRMNKNERHKSIVRPEAIHSALVNAVHHFYLKDGYEYVDVNKEKMVVNHYKYQVWDVFKQKFDRRVATYVSDWRDDNGVGSKDRAPGLGTKPIEPPDWRHRFCEVNDTGLKDLVLEVFEDPHTQLLPWQSNTELMHH